MPHDIWLAERSQLILGNVLDGDANFIGLPGRSGTPGRSRHNMIGPKTTTTSFAGDRGRRSGEPGDEITTTISYRADVGTIVASIGDDAIGGATRMSAIAMPAFPNDPALFTFWRDFFNKATAASKTSCVLSTPVVDVETDCLDEQTMCGLLPLTLGKIAIPRITLTPSALSIQQHGGFTCTQPVVKFSF